MKTKDFFDMFDGISRRCKELMGYKSAEYARNDDKLHNFKEAAKLEKCTPEKALRGMLTKHIISVYDFIDDLEHEKHHTMEQWDEKIIDSINYFILLRALLAERFRYFTLKGEDE